MTSPNRYSPHQPEGYHHIGGRLSIHPIERYEDTIQRCLPPPSPAPTSDRFIMGIPAPSLSSISSNGSNSNVSINGINQQQQQQQSHHHHHHFSSSSSSSNSEQQQSHIINNCNNNTNNNNNVNKYQQSTTIHRTMSPSSRFRISERYHHDNRDLSPKCNNDRYITTTTHFLTNSTPLVSSDAYTYLSSAVHTPVKRYVPTPPPPSTSDLYNTSDLQQQQHQSSSSSSSLSNSSNSGYHTISGTNSAQHLQYQQQQQQQQQQHHQQTSHHVNTLPYRFRMKCCLTDQQSQYNNLITQQQNSQQQQQQNQQNHRDRVNVTNHYATPPRVRPIKCSTNTISTLTSSSSSNNHQNTTITSNNGSGLQTTILPQTLSSSINNCNNSAAIITTGQQQQNLIRQSRATSSLTSQCTATVSSSLNEYITRTPSIEYLGSAGGRVVTPVSVLSEPINSTCLHCNTIKRTTGVHQTTQTTGPISPIPQQQLLTASGTTASSTIQQQNSTSITTSNNNNNNIQDSTLDERHSSVSPTLSTKHIQISPLSPQISSSSLSALQQQTSISSNLHQNDQLICNTLPIQQQQQSSHNPINQNSTILSSLTNSGRSNLSNGQQLQQQQQQQHHHYQQNIQGQFSVTVPSQQQNQQQQNQRQQQNHNLITSNNNSNNVNNTNNNNNNLLTSTPQRNTLTIRQQMQQRFTRKQRLKEYVRKEIAQFFGVDTQIEDNEKHKWYERQKRLAIRRFGPLKSDIELNYNNNGRNNILQQLPGDRPDILPIQTTAEESHINNLNNNINIRLPIQKKSTVPTMIIAGIFYIIQTLNKRQLRNQKQWSRSFAPSNIQAINGDNPGDICEGLTILQEEEVFFDTSGNDIGNNSRINSKIIEHSRQIYMGERVNGWRTSSTIEQQSNNGTNNNNNNSIQQNRLGYRGTRISSQLLDGVLENSRRPLFKKIKMFHLNELDDRNDHRPFFTYWINTVQILVLILSLICYGIGPIGFGIEQKTGQVLVTSLSLQTVQHQEQRNVWIGPRNNDLVHLGAKFAACMRRDVKIIDVISKTRRQERETACCIRNDDSGCVQSSQADCSVRGLWPTKSISTWKKWSPGESGPGGRISGSVCGLDPKYCDAPASIAPYEWPDDITKWPICRKTNSFSQRFRYKDHTAEHMVCEVIGHPCCTGVFGECRITTREYCDFVNGYFHEEASLCSQVSCLNNVCGMFPFLAIEVPDQFYRLFTSLCLHAGILHLAITVAFQHIFLADLERLIGPIRTAIVYIGSGLAGNLTSAILVPYKPEVGPLASLAGVISSLVVLLLLIHWRKLKKPHLALLKLILIGGTLFGMGTLPWQQNFAGLIAGIFCGVFLTIALVPFVSITKYGRKAKINLIWTCILFHLFIYTIMFVIFYIFPTELTSINIGDMLNGNTINMNNNNNNHKNRFDIDNFGSNNIPINNINNNNQHHNNHHHHTDVIDQGGEDRVMSGGTVNEMTSISNLNIIKYINNNTNNNINNLTKINIYINNNNNSNNLNINLLCKNNNTIICSRTSSINLLNNKRYNLNNYNISINIINNINNNNNTNKNLINYDNNNNKLNNINYNYINNNNNNKTSNILFINNNKLNNTKNFIINNNSNYSKNDNKNNINVIKLINNKNNMNKIIKLKKINNNNNKITLNNINNRLSISNAINRHIITA